MRSRKEEILLKIEELQAELAKLEIYGDDVYALGTVISWKDDVHCVAIKALDDDLTPWDFCGVQHSWDDLKREFVGELFIVTMWEKVSK